MKKTDFFGNEKVNFDKLLEFGFYLKEDSYHYTKIIVNNQFRLDVIITLDGKIDTKLTDTRTEELYILHKVNNNNSEFIDLIIGEYDNILNQIKNNCFEKVIFQSNDAKQIIEYVENKYHNKLEFLWTKFPTYAVFKRSDTNKWYAIMMIIPKSKLNLKGHDDIEVLDLRLKPEQIENLIDNEKYFTGYHMNKKHWYLICLNGSVEIDKIKSFIDESYILAK